MPDANLPEVGGEPGDHSDLTTDKEGYVVDETVQEALETLDALNDVHRVMCDYYESGMIQVFTHQTYVPGTVIDAFEDLPYRIRFAKTRTAFVDKKGGRGYVEADRTDTEDRR